MQTKRQIFAKYRDETFEKRFVSYKAVQDWVKQASVKSSRISASVIGHSAEEREIYRLTVGSGRISILLWSQMHGDESTATLAMFDVLNFLLSDDECNDFRSKLLKSCTFHFIPMLNPDGAERWQRRNAQGIDLNRDFIALQSPESRILKNQQEILQPEFAFNLHDQDSLWSVSGSREPALISLLAPPADNSLQFTPSMKRAIQIIASVFNYLEEEIPGKIGRWKDEYEPRAVGETFQKAEVATILIESGGYNNETTKQYVRKLNFDALLHSFQIIAFGEMHDESAALSTYDAIPLNSKEIFHMVIRDCRLQTAAGNISLDIALNHEPVDRREERIYLISDMGDLSPFSAYFEVDAEGAMIRGENIEVNSKASFRLEGKNGKNLNVEDGKLKDLNFEL